MSFHQLPFSQRFSKLGDEAEGAFTTVNPSAHDLGLRRPAFSMSGMPANLRNIPDFALPDGMYEVMGFSSRGGSLKLKFEKADSLRAWDGVAPVYLWVYDSYKKRYWVSPIRAWLNACYEHGEVDRFPDNDQPYWALKCANFPGEAVPCASSK